MPEQKPIGARCFEFIDRHPAMPWPERMIAFALAERARAIEDAAHVANYHLGMATMSARPEAVEEANAIEKAIRALAPEGGEK